LLPLVGQVISQKTQNNQSVNATLTKARFFAIPFSFAVLGPNLFLFKFTKKEHTTRILKSVWNVNGFFTSIQAWSPSATLGELSLLIVPFWIQVPSLPLHNMPTKNAIAIGKCLGHLVKVEDNSGAAATFQSFLRILVKIDVSKPLNLGFFLSINDGSSSWISMKYKGLDIYYTDCEKIGHKQISCLAQQEERLPSRYLISLKVNVFSNMISSISSSNLPKNYPTSSSSPRKNLIQPFMESFQPYANQKNILTSSQNSLTP
jgi:hypothetical protein